MILLTRRVALSGAIFAFSGCSTIASLNAAAEPLDTYDLLPSSGTRSGPRSSRTLVVALPQAPAWLATDRIVVRSGSQSIAYLPDARWGDELPAVFQTLIIRSISGTGRVGYVGRSNAGPVPDKALLGRIDAFEVSLGADGIFTAEVDVDLTVINDRDQRVVATRRFSESAQVSSDSPTDIVAGFQSILNAMMPAVSDWTVRQV